MTSMHWFRESARVRQTINPALAVKDGKPYIAFGTPGADTQPQAQLQFFLNVVDFGMNVQEAHSRTALADFRLPFFIFPLPVWHSLAG